MVDKQILILSSLGGILCRPPKCCSARPINWTGHVLPVELLLNLLLASWAVADLNFILQLFTAVCSLYKSIRCRLVVNSGSHAIQSNNCLERPVRIASQFGASGPSDIWRLCFPWPQTLCLSHLQVLRFEGHRLL